MPKYCTECGNELVENASFCDECGKNIVTISFKKNDMDLKSIPEITDTSSASESRLLNGRNNRRVIFAILIIFSIIIFVGAGALTGIFNLDTTSETIQDDAFIDWFYDSIEEIRYDCRMITKYSSEYTLYSLELWCEELEDDTDGYLYDIIYDYPVLSKWQSLRNEYYNALKDYNLAGYYGKIGAEYESGEDIRKCADYIDRATDHINRCTEIIYDLM
jgi:hypothetical protein